ncbi:hypothetical protein [Metallibacterium sp.]
MRLQIFEYQCEASGHSFRAPELPIDVYGEFLLRNETDAAMVYLNAIADPTYKEVDMLLQRHPSLAGVPPNRRADILRRIYGAVACDLDSEGRPFRIGQHPKCPVCSSANVRSWQEVQPVEFVDLDIPAATHSIWTALTEDQKADRVNSALS